MIKTDIIHARSNPQDCLYLRIRPFFMVEDKADIPPIYVLNGWQRVSFVPVDNKTRRRRKTDDK